MVATQLSPPSVVTGYATYVPELGQSTATAVQTDLNRLAVQIVSMMETPW